MTLGELNQRLFWPIMIRSFLFGVVADLAIAAALLLTFGGDDIGLLNVLLLTLGIMVLEAILSVKGWVVKTLWLHWFGKHYTETYVLAGLREAKLPPPTEFDQRNFEYLCQVAEDPQALPQDRVNAAGFYAGLKAQWNCQGIVRSLILSNVADKAFATWASEAPRRRTDPTVQPSPIETTG
ncbi:hypothetical protein [Novosphingobium sp. Gsoil 351]|uniref:hypothetical protein n=1 Tax=Novosphingobium sp. Gsoil 351 TaxID=2675225 RepID=UPI0012B4C847|nr:hypothetical protein [Novosphingobium sp. Gsoil 351]QGN53336.1 hypothetical protein GKE62_00985 [Novosphingobium sp. Gsoil 351]